MPIIRQEPQTFVNFTLYDVSVTSKSIRSCGKLTFTNLWDHIYNNYGKEAMN